MRVWFRQHRHALRAATAKFAEQRLTSLLNAIVIGVAFALPVGGYAILFNLRVATHRSAVAPALTVFLSNDARLANAQALAKRLRTDPQIRTFRFISRQEALDELRQTPGLGDVVAALEHNPLSDAFVVHARDTRLPALEALAGKLRAAPNVAHVQVNAGWARRLDALLGLGQLAMSLLGILLGVGLVAVTFNSIRLQILTQRDEIEVSKLIGATDAFIRRPFFYLGLLQGACGGLIALGIIAATFAALGGDVHKLAQSYGSQFVLRFLGPQDAAAAVVVAALLGWLGAYLSVSRYLREIEPQ